MSRVDMWTHPCSLLFARAQFAPKAISIHARSFLPPLGNTDGAAGAPATISWETVGCTLRLRPSTPSVGHPHTCSGAMRTRHTAPACGLRRPHAPSPPPPARRSPRTPPGRACAAALATPHEDRKRAWVPCCTRQRSEPPREGTACKGADAHLHALPLAYSACFCAMMFPFVRTPGTGDCNTLAPHTPTITTTTTQPPPASSPLSATATFFLHVVAKNFRRIHVFLSHV